MGTLYVVATPIGNLEDVTLRAVKVLRSVPLVIAEDTRVTRRLTDKLGVSPRMVSYHGYSKPGKLEQILLLLHDTDAALVTDAGTPAINDPGAELVAEAARRGVLVAPLPGPSAIATALSISGFDVDQFKSLGFIPSKAKARTEAIRSVAEESSAVVFFESPHRVRRTFDAMNSILGARPIVVCRELTKLHEEVWRGTSQSAFEHFTEPKGEFVIVVAPKERNERTAVNMSDAEILSLAEELSGSFDSKRGLAVALSARTGIGRRRIYQLLHHGDWSDERQS